jgi:hypothetical protein
MAFIYFPFLKGTRSLTRRRSNNGPAERDRKDSRIPNNEFDIDSKASGRWIQKRGGRLHFTIKAVELVKTDEHVESLGFEYR